MAPRSVKHSLRESSGQSISTLEVLGQQPQKGQPPRLDEDTSPRAEGPGVGSIPCELPHRPRREVRVGMAFPGG